MRRVRSAAMFTALTLAGLALAAGGAGALEFGSVDVDMKVGTKTFKVTAQPPKTWQTVSEGQITLDHKFSMGANDGQGTVQVKLAPAPKQVPKKMNPCVVLQGVAKTLKQQGVKVAAGRHTQANMAPVCSMVAESSLKTRFYYASMFLSGGVLIAGIVSANRDLDDGQVNDFQRYLASIKATPKEPAQ